MGLKGTFDQHKISDRLVYNKYIFGRKKFLRRIPSSAVEPERQNLAILRHISLFENYITFF